MLLPRTTGWNTGDILICIGMMFAPLGNHFAKISRKETSVTTVLTTRYITSIPFLIVLTLLFETTPDISTVRDVLPALVMMAGLVFVLKNICWVEAIRHVTVTRILSIH